MRILEADRHSLDIALLIELPSDTAFVCVVSHSAVIWAKEASGKYLWLS